MSIIAHRVAARWLTSADSPLKQLLGRLRRSAAQFEKAAQLPEESRKQRMRESFAEVRRYATLLIEAAMKSKETADRKLGRAVHDFFTNLSAEMFGADDARAMQRFNAAADAWLASREAGNSSGV